MYLELHAASAFSFLRGASLPEELAQRAAELDLPALALLDRNGVYGAPRFYRAARKVGLRPLVGAEVTLPNGAALPLLVENRIGYQNLCRLLTRLHRGAPKGAGALDWDELAPLASGLIALSGGEDGPAALALNQAGGGAEAAGRQLDCLLRVFGPGRVYVELQRHCERAEEARNRVLVELARARRLPLLATNGVRYALPAGRTVLDVFTCLRHHTRLDDAGRRLSCNAERYLKPAAAIAPLFADLPEALANTVELAQRLQFSLDDLGYRFPRAPVPEGHTMTSWLRQLTEEGARRRYRPYHERARRQIAHELEIIAKLQLEGYFLIVDDIMRFCRQEGILAQGRGSAANSAVCYSLGITAVDPVGMELLFERFLSAERGEWPDIDIDLPSGERRERVIQYVYRRHGGEGGGAAMTANVITYRGRSAAREVGKVLGFPAEVSARLSTALGSLGFTDAPAPSGGETAEARFPAHSDEVAAPVAQALRQAGLDGHHPRLRRFLELCQAMQDLPRHLGQHSGGMVICQGALDAIVPLEPASMPGRVVVQWDKDDCSDLGIIKVDLLGLGMMSVLQDALLLARNATVHPAGPPDLTWIPPEDPSVYAALQAADTIGVFQVESRAQMATLPRLRPRRFYDLVVQVALIRPGPIVGKMVHPYLRRRNGEEPVRYPHPFLEPILRRTLGVPLFQEQLLRMAMAVAGFSGGQAEELRRAMGFKRSAARMAALERQLRAGMAAQGITGEAAEEIVTSITSFALYGFPESHAASFALLVYASAYLKVHNPEAFLVALLNHQPMGFYHPATLVKDAQRHGVRILPVSLNHSAWDCTVEAVAGPQPLAVRLGFRLVAGLNEATGRALAEERRHHGPYRSVEELRQRTSLRRDEARRLAALGALHGLEGGCSRRNALWQVEAALRPAGPLLENPEPSALAPAPLPEMTARERLWADFRGAGLTLGPHPLAFERPALERLGVVPAARLRHLPNHRRVQAAGLVITRQRPQTAKGVLFLSLEDETGIANGIVRPELFEAQRMICVTAPALWVEGKLQNVQGVVHVLVEQLLPLHEKLRAPAASTLVPAHDFR